MVKTMKSVSLLLVISLVLAFFGTVLPASPVRAATITVDDGGGADYTTIQAAIDNANTGDTIIVSGGPYNENVNVNKSVTIRASGPVDVNAAIFLDNVFSIWASNVNIYGFTVTGATNVPKAGIYVYYTATGCNIKNNTAYGNYIGIQCESSMSIIQDNTVRNNSHIGIGMNRAESCTTIGNIAYSNPKGIAIWNYSTGNTVTSNTVYENTDGIYLSDSSNGNTISGNTANGNGTGIGIYSSSGNTISNNTTKNNADIGIYLYYATNNTVTGNETGNNPSTEQDYGIKLYSAGNNTITGNTVTYNELMGIYTQGSNENTFSDNQIYNNGAEGIYLSGSIECTIDGNTIHDNDLVHAGILLSSGYLCQVVNNEIYNEAYGVYLDGSDDCTIQHNSVHDNGHGIYVAANSDDNQIVGNSIIHNKQTEDSGIHITAGTSNTAVHFNVIVANCSAEPLFGLYNGTTHTVNAENNWWGANNGPVPVGDGDKVSNYVDYDPWLVLTINANPTSIPTGAIMSAITASLTMNSDGEDTSAIGHVYDGTEIIFTTDKGTIGSMQTTKLTESGKAIASLKSSVAGTATVCAEAPHGDEVPVNQYKVCTSVKLIPVQQPAKPFEDSSSSFPGEHNLTTRPNLSTKYVNVQPQQVQANQPVTVYASVANSGDEAGDYEVILKVNGQVEEVKKGIVGGHAAVPLQFEVLRAAAGTYTVDINGQKSYFTVAGEDDKTGLFAGNNKLLALVLWGILVIAVITALAIVVVRRKQSYY